MSKYVLLAPLPRLSVTTSMDPGGRYREGFRLFGCRGIAGLLIFFVNDNLAGTSEGMN